MNTPEHLPPACGQLTNREVTAFVHFLWRNAMVRPTLEGPDRTIPAGGGFVSLVYKALLLSIDTTSSQTVNVM